MGAFFCTYHQTVEDSDRDGFVMFEGEDFCEDAAEDLLIRECPIHPGVVVRGRWKDGYDRPHFRCPIGHTFYEAD
jgi:hypothetical protein